MHRIALGSDRLHRAGHDNRAASALTHDRNGVIVDQNIDAPESRHDFRDESFHVSAKTRIRLEERGPVVLASQFRYGLLARLRVAVHYCDRCASVRELASASLT